MKEDEQERRVAVYVRRPAEEIEREARAGSAAAAARDRLRTPAAEAEPDARTPEQRWAQELLEAVESFEAERVAARIGRCRPLLEEQFGPELVQRVLDARWALDFAVVMEGRGVDVDEALAGALRYLREHRGASVSDAFNAVQEALVRDGDVEE